jgi:two-component system CheB/CheR fusion protein
MIHAVQTGQLRRRSNGGWRWLRWTDDMDRYIDILRSDTRELDLLAKDLLIHVTSFFRDPKVFDLLEEKIIPELVRSQAPDHSIRIWIAGCSTGEETYSLAMLFLEQITAAKRNIKLQVFASDVDPDAVASAREGLYPETIEADVSPARLARFFSKEDHVTEYRPSCVQPWSSGTGRACPITVLRLDLVSCQSSIICAQRHRQKSSRFFISLCAPAAFCFLAAPKRSVLDGAEQTPAGAPLSTDWSRPAESLV